MALTLTVPGNASDMAGVPGNNKYVIKRIQFDSSYPTNGESLTATDLGLESIHIVIIDTELIFLAKKFDIIKKFFSRPPPFIDGMKISSFLFIINLLI